MFLCLRKSIFKTIKWLKLSVLIFATIRDFLHAGIFKSIEFYNNFFLSFSKAIVASIVQKNWINSIRRFPMKVFLTTIFLFAWLTHLTQQIEMGHDYSVIFVLGTIIILCGVYFSFKEIKEDWSKL